MVSNPSATVRSLRKFVVSSWNVNIWTALLPLMVRRFVPGPVIVVLSVTAGKGAASVTVPEIVKSMVSSPTVTLESRMDCRNEPAPASAVVVTVKVAAGVREAKPSQAKNSNPVFINERNLLFNALRFRGNCVSIRFTGADFTPP